MFKIFTYVAKCLFGSRNQRIVKSFSKVVKQINALEQDLMALDDQSLANKTQWFREQIKQGKSLDDLLPEAFAVVRETAKRLLNMRHFDVQLIGGMVLHSGKVAEMGTGEGKTLVATLPAYLNALNGEGVHVVTVNDYLAQRDAKWMSPIFAFLGLSVGTVYSDQPLAEKKTAYQADIIYGTNNEFGFDYLRDNMAFGVEDKVQKTLNFAIVDEVDSILIDEARTPLIISGIAEDSSQLYRAMNAIAPKLDPQAERHSEGDYYVDQKAKQVYLSEQGHERAEALLLEAGLIQAGESLYSMNNIILMHHLYASIRAHTLFNKNIDYMVKDNEIVIVDEHTGRAMPGRRWSDGLHQAVEAKEGVTIQSENQTLASITFQNFFRNYAKLSGMTGTADTEAFELHQIYGLEVVVVPTNKPTIRKDTPDLVYMTAQEKYEAIIEDIVSHQAKGCPVLVGTVSIESSELISMLLKKQKIKHNVLNAKFHEQEAEIIAQAGKPGAITIATNMAGRGTDIVLGGNLQKALAELSDASEEAVTKVKQQWQQDHDKVIAAGGLRVVGTERHESRRIDNQLRGRSGRQGDPGRTTFYLSLEDNLLRIFAADRIKGLMTRFGMEKGTSLESSLLSRCIENAQRKVEAHNFDIRKQLLEYDDVANDQRSIVYEQRARLMEANDLSSNVENMSQEVFATLCEKHVPSAAAEDEWDADRLSDTLKETFAISFNVADYIANSSAFSHEALVHKVVEHFRTRIAEKQGLLGVDMLHQFEKSVMLQALDMHWKEHLSAMDHLRQGIHLRGYAQKNPKQEYKREAYALFTEMLAHTKQEIIATLSAVKLKEASEVSAAETVRREAAPHQLELTHATADSVLENSSNPAEQNQDQEKPKPFVQTQKIGRNAPCFCGSGKKYKHCHGRL